MDGQYAKVSKEVVQKFEFKRGQAGEVIQGHYPLFGLSTCSGNHQA